MTSRRILRYTENYTEIYYDVNTAPEYVWSTVHHYLDTVYSTPVPGYSLLYTSTWIQSTVHQYLDTVYSTPVPGYSLQSVYSTPISGYSLQSVYSTPVSGYSLQYISTWIQSTVHQYLDTVSPSEKSEASQGIVEEETPHQVEDNSHWDPNHHRQSRHRGTSYSAEEGLQLNNKVRSI